MTDGQSTADLFEQLRQLHRSNGRRSILDGLLEIIGLAENSIRTYDTAEALDTLSKLRSCVTKMRPLIKNTETQLQEHIEKLNNRKLLYEAHLELAELKHDAKNIATLRETLVELDKDINALINTSIAAIDPQPEISHN